MPYVIATTRPELASVIEPGQPWPCTVARRGVATIEEARDACGQYIADHKREPHRPWRQWLKPSATLPESGGTVGPLPDGTTITVQPIAWDALRVAAGWPERRASVPALLIDAYNARQEAVA